MPAEPPGVWVSGAVDLGKGVSAGRMHRNALSWIEGGANMTHA